MLYCYIYFSKYIYFLFSDRKGLLTYVKLEEKEQAETAEASGAAVAAEQKSEQEDDAKVSKALTGTLCRFSCDGSIVDFHQARAISCEF